MLKTPCRGAASTCLSWESRYPWGTVSLCQRHAAQDLPKSVLSFLVTLCTVLLFLTHIGVNLLGLMAAGGVSYLLDRIHPEEIKKIVKKTSGDFLRFPGCAVLPSGMQADSPGHHSSQLP